MTSMSAEEITAAFADASKALPPCVGRLSDNYIQTMVETLASVLVPILFDITNGNVDSLLALVTTDLEYQDAFGRAFVVPAQVGIYDVTIPGNANGRQRAEREAIHNACRTDRATFDAAVRCVRQFIIDHVEDDWIRTHRYPVFLYAHTPCRALLQTLLNIATGRQATDHIALLNEMQTFFKKASGLPQYIIMLEDLQKQALRMDRNDPITDQMILGLAEADVLSSAQYPCLEEDWSRLPVASKT